MLQAAISHRAEKTQSESQLLRLPYELLFQVAYCLSAEDLLRARMTCHLVDDMLKAESARFWLHASLQRKARVRSGYNRQTSRSLMLEALEHVLPAIIRPSDPVEMLARGTGISRALKWVYLNADWVRKQHLPALDVVDERLSFRTGDVAFEVFRHMPDKQHLGIQVQRNEERTVELIHVPANVYQKLQTDPFSFVAAETLSELEVLSNWHLATVAFVTMTLIFIGQYASDMARAYVLPPDFTWYGL